MSARGDGRVQEVTQNGRRVLILENASLRVEILPDKGSDIVSFLHKPSGVDPMLRTPAAGRPRPTTAAMADMAGYLDQYEGGWQDCLPNGGPGVFYRGVAIPFHGELWAASWSVDVVESRGAGVTAILRTRTTQLPLAVEKRLTLLPGRSALEIEESVTNPGLEPVDLMWGQHPAFGAPFLDDSCRIDLPSSVGSTERAAPIPSSKLAFGERFTWPMAPLEDGGTLDLRSVPGPDARRSDWVSLAGFHDGRYGITNGRSRVGFGLRWDPGVFPYLWFWQDWGSEPVERSRDPGYACALEPWTSRPDSGLLEAVANGTARVLAGGATLSTRLLAVMYDHREGIGGITEDGEVLS